MWGGHGGPKAEEGMGGKPNGWAAARPSGSLVSVLRDPF